MISWHSFQIVPYLEVIPPMFDWPVWASQQGPLPNTCVKNSPKVALEIFQALCHWTISILTISLPPPQNSTSKLDHPDKTTFSTFRHYGTNRAPLTLSFDAAWLKINKGFVRVLSDWIKEKLTGQSDVYFVTELQVSYRYLFPVRKFCPVMQFRKWHLRRRAEKCLVIARVRFEYWDSRA